MVLPLVRLLSRNRQLSTLTICVVLSIVSLALPMPAKNAVSTVLSGGILGPFKRVARSLVEIGSMREDNALLRRIAVELADDRAALLEYKHENDRLRELLSFFVAFDEEERSEMLPARVIGMPGGRVVERIEVDKGALDGVKKNMPVVVPDGLVGKISSVFEDRALVEPLVSASSAAGVVVERSRVRGVVRPRFGSATTLAGWEMDYVPARSDVRIGDLVVTSGLGGVYPPSLVVGHVTSVVQGPLTMDIRVDLAVRYSTIEQVFIITGRTAGVRVRPENEDELLRELGLINPEEDP